MHYHTEAKSMQKQSKSEPLGVSMAKMILVVSFIVFFGVLMGAAGYLAKNKPVGIPISNHNLALAPTLFLTPTPSDVENCNHLYENCNYVYTDKIVNPFTGEKYMIRKDSDAGCGLNGAIICDLVVERNGTIKTIANVYYQTHGDNEKNFAIDMPSGATLVEFTSPSILIIGFGYGDHGGGFESIQEFNLETKKLGKELINYSFLEDYLDDNYPAFLYEISVGSKKLAFVNRTEGYESPYELPYKSTGIFINDNGKIRKINFAIDPSYSLNFDVKANYKNPDLINIEINSKNYKFDFTTEKFISL